MTYYCNKLMDRYDNKKTALSQGNRAMSRVIYHIPTPPRISGWSPFS